MAEPAVQTMSYADYCDLVERSMHKHAWLRGQVWAMAGGSPVHAAIIANALAALVNALRERPCTVYASDLRVRSEAADLSAYPDGSVICGPLQLASDDPQAVTNPTLLLEVLSPSTEAFDRGDKFLAYQRLESLRHYVLVHQRRQLVEHFQRQQDGSWLLRTHGPDATVNLGELAELPVAGLYANTTVPPLAEPSIPPEAEPGAPAG